MLIFHKNEVQLVILRCLTSLDLNWYKRFDTKRIKTQKTQKSFLFTKSQKTQIFAFYVITIQQIKI